MYPIVDKKILNPSVVELHILAPLVAKKAQPGQFIILRVDEEGERIPLTVAGVDQQKGTVKIIYQIVGATTLGLSQKDAGDSLQDFVGPLGVPTHLDGLKKVCIIGGGVGCAIAMPVAEKCHEMGMDVTSIIGFRSKDLLIPLPHGILKKSLFYRWRDYLVKLQRNLEEYFEPSNAN